MSATCTTVTYSWCGAGAVVRNRFVRVRGPAYLCISVNCTCASVLIDGPNMYIHWFASVNRSPMYTRNRHSPIKSHAPQANVVLAVPVINGHGGALLLGAPILDPMAVELGTVALSACLFLHYAVVTIQQVTSALNIRCFNVGHRVPEPASFELSASPARH